MHGEKNINVFSVLEILDDHIILLIPYTLQGDLAELLLVVIHVPSFVDNSETSFSCNMRLKSAVF